jgi:predicted MFS family arabinose efflux permease
MSVSASKMTRAQEISTLLVLCAIQVTHSLDFTMVMPLGPRLMRSLEVGPSEFGWLLSSYTFAAGVSAILGSGFVDRYDRKSVLLTLFTGFSLGTLGCMVATNFYALLIARVISGFFGGVLSATVLAVIGDAYPAERRGWATGIVMTSFSVSSVLGIPLSLACAERWGWNASFGLLAVVCFAVFPIALFGMPPMRGHLSRASAHGHSKEPALQKILRVIRTIAYQRVFVFTAVLVLAGFAVIPFLSPSIVANVGFSEHDLQFIYISGGLATFFTAQIIGRMVDRYGASKMFTWTAMISLLPIAIVSNLGPTPMGLVLVATTMFMIFFNARWVSAMTLVNREIQPEDRGAVMNLNSSVQAVSSGFGALIGAALVSAEAGTNRLLGFNRVGWFAMVMTVTAVWVARRLLRPGHARYNKDKKRPERSQDSAAPRA